MKALVKKEASEGLWLEEAPIPEIGINDVLIKVLKTAICGTDVHIYNWDEWAQKTIKIPITIGHEFVGEIVKMGENVHDFKIGDIVTAEGHVVCGRCICGHPGGFNYLGQFMPPRQSEPKRRLPFNLEMTQHEEWKITNNSKKGFPQACCSWHRRSIDRLWWLPEK